MGLVDMLSTPELMSDHRGVSPKLQLNKSLASNLNEVHNIPLRAINCAFGMVTKSKEDAVPLKSVAKRHARKGKSDVMIVFAVRSPGCGSCREHGQQLSALAKEERVALAGIVKEVGVDDEALSTFYSEYFHHPLYQDEKWKVYNAMGGRKVNAFSLVKGYLASSKRHEAKGITNKLNGQGDGWMMGGLLIFDRRGVLQYAYEEQFGEELDIPAIRSAINALRSESAGYSSDEGSIDGVSLEALTVSS